MRFADWSAATRCECTDLTHACFCILQEQLGANAGLLQLSARIQDSSCAS